MLRSAQHKILILIAYGQRPVIDVHADTSSGARVFIYIHPSCMRAVKALAQTHLSNVVADTICCVYSNNCLNETFLSTQNTCLNWWVIITIVCQKTYK